jgi:hypothetical protein
VSVITALRKEEFMSKEARTRFLRNSQDFSLKKGYTKKEQREVIETSDIT